MEPPKISVINYREINKNSLRGFFTLVIGPMGITIHDCRHLAQGENQWWSMPQKEVKYTDGRKTDYFPLVNIENRAFYDLLKATVMESLKNIKPTERKHGQTKVPNDKAPAAKGDPLQSDASDLWF